jgi:hypothetical protein
MATTYTLIFIVLFNIILFRKIIFRWNVFGIFFISTMIFSMVGILAFPFIKSYVYNTFYTFKLYLIPEEVFVQTQIIAVAGLLLVLYSYVFGLLLLCRKVWVFDHFRISHPIKDNLSKVNFYFLVLAILAFLSVYLFIKKDLLIRGLTDGLIGRQPVVLLESRRGITSNYLYVVITYNLLPFLTIVGLYITMKIKTLSSKLLFTGLFLLSFTLILLLFQKRPLIIFLLSISLSFFVFKKYINISKRVRTAKEKKRVRRRVALVGLTLFSILLLLYYAGTTYQFDNIFDGVTKLTEIVLTRVFGRLSIPAFCYVYYFPMVEGHYGITNIGLLSKFFRYELFLDSKEVFAHFTKTDKKGSMAINSILDFYAAFGYYGLIIGNIVLGLFLSALDVFLNRLEKNNINMIFIVFCFVFAYYLSQASLARSLLGYGFFFFMLAWMFLQKNFRIKLRP